MLQIKPGAHRAKNGSCLRAGPSWTALEWLGGKPIGDGTARSLATGQSLAGFSGWCWSLNRDFGVAALSVHLLLVIRGSHVLSSQRGH